MHPYCLNVQFAEMANETVRSGLYNMFAEGQYFGYY